tara:strand:+ start:199 stop:879 length:681 start_codon:yes stop_codon:yes gene_type:complete
MSQHDLNIANQVASSARTDINNALVALGTTLSGTSAPSLTTEGTLWYDTTNNELKIREGSSWVSIGEVDSTFKANVDLALQGDAETGSDATKTMTALRVKQSIDYNAPFANSYTSSELTISAAGSYTLTHSLVTIPSLVKIYFVCKTAEYGYSVGDVVDFSNITSMWTTGTVYYIGPTIVMNTTQIKVKFGSNYAFLLNNFSTGGAGGVGNVPTYSSWRLLIKAWK